MAERGIWSGSFQAPWDWRADHRDDGQATSAPLFAFGNTGCNIKGNISADGERYLLPRQKFCSEAEARAAGWRRSKR
jgi:hypothetical protein